MPPSPPSKKHLRIDRFHHAADYKSKKRAASKSVPQRPNFKGHGQGLLKDFQGIQNDYAALTQAWEGKENIEAKGIVVELQSAPDVEIDQKRLEENGWQLLNERQPVVQGKVVSQQSWFVPDGKLGVLASILNDYLTKTTKRLGKQHPKYRPLIDAIERVAKAAATQLWTEKDAAFPADETLWFEVWLRGGLSDVDRNIILNQFKALSQAVGLRVGNGIITLPEHTIVAAYGKGSSFSTDLALLSCIAEIRRGRDYADYFVSLRPEEQAA